MDRGYVYALRCRYSNDNQGSTETVTVAFDGTTVGAYGAQDTGGSGQGWNVFVPSGALGLANPRPGPHTISVTVTGRDGVGIELDAVTIDAILCPLCIPLVSKG